mmetsp:Transcript_125558/g.390893  ORF Transcript_125558/g.390893 Transcript_125558/m.390893 type:complete len:263 (-) Transcript_125558:303-1091(-)
MNCGAHPPSLAGVSRPPRRGSPQRRWLRLCGALPERSSTVAGAGTGRARHRRRSMRGVLHPFRRGCSAPTVGCPNRPLWLVCTRERAEPGIRRAEGARRIAGASTSTRRRSAGETQAWGRWPDARQAGKVAKAHQRASWPASKLQGPRAAPVAERQPRQYSLPLGNRLKRVQRPPSPRRPGAGATRPCPTAATSRWPGGGCPPWSQWRRHPPPWHQRRPRRRRPRAARRACPRADLQGKALCRDGSPSCTEPSGRPRRTRWS